MKKLLVVSVIALLGVASVASAAITLPNPLCMRNGPNCINSFPSLITAITNFVVIAIGGLAVIMFVWAGILFVTSAGNEAQVTKAKTAVKYAVVGLIIATAGSGLIRVIQEVIGPAPRP